MHRIGISCSNRCEPPNAETNTTARNLSRWTQSKAKRALDFAAVFACLPVLSPLLVFIALAVLVTSGAPILFRQERAGRNGVPFVIYKFRTMRAAPIPPPNAIATQSATRITWFGAILRRTKLDELPQVFNVLIGDMTLVGPRPKVAEQELEPLPCRPGLTGAATLAFAREEMILQGIATADLERYFRETILSAKRDLDSEYSRRATIWSDLKILVNTVMGRWDSEPVLDHGDAPLQACRETASVPQ